MTTSAKTEAKLKAVDAFAPFADALEAIPNLEVPEVARDVAKRMTGFGEKFATDGREAVEKATATIEKAAVSSVREFGQHQSSRSDSALSGRRGAARRTPKPLRGRVSDGRPPNSVGLFPRPGERRRGTRQGDRGLCRPSRVETGSVRQLKAPAAGPNRRSRPNRTRMRASSEGSPRRAFVRCCQPQVSGVCRRGGRPSQGTQIHERQS